MTCRRWRLRLLVLPLLAVVAAATPRPAGAQTPVEMAGAQTRYIVLKASAKPEGELRREIEAIDAAVAEALRAGDLGEAQRQYAKGIARLSGQAWTAGLDYASSVAFRSDRVFVDPAAPCAARLEPFYQPAVAPDGALTARVTLHRVPMRGATGAAARGDLVRELGTFTGISPNLRDSPPRFDLSLAGIGDGRYVVEVEVLHHDAALVLRGFLIEVRKGLDARLAKLADGLAGVSASLAETFGADVRYPADFIRKVNGGVVEIGNFDVDREVTAAEDVLRSLTRGRDPFADRRGDYKRHYIFADAGEIMPYHVFVPAAYDGRRALPLIVALHGSGGDEDAYFPRPDAPLPTLAQQRGYLVVAPLGYRVDGRYGAGTSQDPAVRRKRELSEADVLNVLDLVRRQYRVDEERIYILGHSMGAMGAWRLGAKFPDRWAALACFSGSGRPEDEAAMKNLPQFVVHGDRDDMVPVAASRAMVSEMKRLGTAHKYIEVPGGDHLNVVEPNLEAAFEFFDAHRRKLPRPPG